MMIQLDIDALMNGEIRTVNKYGGSQHCKWRCEDDYIVGYSTAKITNSIGKKYDNKFACIVWKPVKLKGKIIRWEIKYYRAFRQRKKAKEYALKFYYEHSPKAEKRHGYDKVKLCGCPKDFPEVHQEGCRKLKA